VRVPSDRARATRRAHRQHHRPVGARNSAQTPDVVIPG
jgi:hypothetical protein